MKAIISLFLFTLFLLPTQVMAKRTQAEKDAKREERKAKREAKKNSYGISKSTKSWKCRKGKGTNSKSDCRSDLRGQCTMDGWKYKSNRCKMIKRYYVKASSKALKCKKSYTKGVYDDKSKCVQELKTQCSAKKSDGWTLKGSKCKQGKKFEIKESNSGLKCKKSKTGSYLSKSDCGDALKKQCAAKKDDGYTMKGRKCKKGKTFTIKDAKSGLKCKKSKTGEYKSKTDCADALKIQCEAKKSDGYEMKGRKCKKGKAYEIKVSKKGGLKCKKSKTGKIQSLDKCKTELAIQCKNNGLTLSSSKKKCKAAKVYIIKSNRKGNKLKCKKTTGKTKKPDYGSHYEDKASCSKELSSICGKETKLKEFKMRGSFCSEGGKSRAGKLISGLGEKVKDGIGGLDVKELGGKAINFKKKKDIDKQKKHCEQQAKIINSISVDVFKIEVEDGEEVYKNTGRKTLSSAQINTSLSHDTLKEFKESYASDGASSDGVKSFTTIVSTGTAASMRTAGQLKYGITSFKIPDMSKCTEEALAYPDE